jgi:cyclopropane fatty-acyl-phospholipid synthase-like methyltransferase
MLTDDELRAALHRDRYPRASRYDPRTVLETDLGKNVLWLTESVCEHMRLEPGMRVLDLGAGDASSSVFLAREFGVRVWAVDKLIPPARMWKRIEHADVTDRVCPIRGDARSLPFPPRFFHAVVSIDAFQYFGTDDFFLRDLVAFLTDDADVGIVVPGVHGELDAPPDYFDELWRDAAFAALHTPAWWHRHWSRTGLVGVRLAEMVPDGWRDWLAWRELVLASGRNKSPLARAELDVLAADGGSQLGLVRMVATRRA